MDIIDLCRSMIPQNLQVPLRWIYSRIPIEARMGKNYWYLRAFLEKAQWWNREQIEAWQLERLKLIVQYAYANVPGYNNLYREAGVKPEDIESLKDIQILPFTYKELFRDNLDDFTSRKISSWRRRYVSTSGSTGIPFGFFDTNDNTTIENAFIHQAWESVGWKIGDVSAVLRGGFVGTEQQYWHYNAITRELFLSSYYLSKKFYEKFINKMREYGIRYIQAYPSVITELSDLIIENDDFGRIKNPVILLGSENVYTWQLCRIHKAFPDCRVFAWYGHSEKAIFATWCASSKKYHIWPFYGITEVLNRDDTIITDEDVGELVGTSFFMQATPFIRYRTSDIVEVGQGYCTTCNRQFRIINKIIGREQNFLVTLSGNRIPIPTTSIHDKTLINVKQYQFYQEMPGRVVLRIIPNSDFSSEDSSTIKQELIKKLGNDFDLEFKFVTKISKTKQGKLLFVEQKIRY